MPLPDLFLERLKKIIPPECFDSVLKTFSNEEALAVRVNTLKSHKDKVLYFFRQQGLPVEEVRWYHDALVLGDMNKRKLGETSLVKNGFVFMQSLSSMLVPLIVDPKPGEHILDMCAAPGGKATQMAAMMQNQGNILALDSVRDRFFRLKAIVDLLGADIVEPRLMDGRRFSRGVNLFDRILVDAPCSSEGRFKIHVSKTYDYWSFAKIKEMCHKQRELLINASRFLKPGGTLVYSTCTFAPEENEGVIDWLLEKTKNTMRVLQPENYPIATYPALKEWNNKTFHSQVSNCVRVLPTETMEGFFIAKLMKMI